MAKRSRRTHNWLSTRDAATALGLSHMTIIRRFDAGDLDGYHVPGSRFRRIPRESLLAFAKKHGMPVILPENGELPVSGGNGPGGPSRALVVEDDPSIARLVERVLKADGWDVRVARDGFQAGFLAGSFLPQLVILDILLPGVDGREACRRMREDPRLAGTKIMAVTALSDAKSVREIFEAGVDAYLSKPFQLSDLREKIASLVGGAPGAGNAASGVKAGVGATDE